jgi:hypothetical protein
MREMYSILLAVTLPEISCMDIGTVFGNAEGMFFESCMGFLTTNEEQDLLRGKQNQIDGLTDFFHRTGGESWVQSWGWLSGDPCTISWYGVDCDCSGNIVSLQLPDNNLSGQVPSTLNGLYALQVIDLHSSTKASTNSNKLLGNVPSLGNLTGLRVLDLSMNSISSLPSDIGSNGMLEVLSVSNNDLSALPVSLGSLRNLRVLEFEGNNIFDEFPAGDICKAQNILIINLANNSMEGTFYDPCLQQINPLVLDLTARVLWGTNMTKGLIGDVPMDLVSNWSNIDSGYVSMYLQPNLTGHFGSVCADLRFCRWQNFRSHGDLGNAESENDVPISVFDAINLAKSWKQLVKAILYQNLRKVYLVTTLVTSSI